MKWIIALLGGPSGGSILATVGGIILALFAALGLALVTQTARLKNAQADVVLRDARIEKINADLVTKAAEAQRLSAENAALAADLVAERQNADREPVERVVTRILRECPEVRTDGDLPRAAAAGTSARSNPETGNGGGRTFAEKLGRDIATCNDQLNRFRGVCTFVYGSAQCQ